MLPYRFHIAVHLYSNRSQVMSKYGRNNNRGTGVACECVIDVPTTFDVHCHLLQTLGNVEICFIC